MATSQNGWPVNPARTYRQVPGSTVHLTVADGVAGDVLMYVAREFDRRVEDIDWKSSRGEFDDWGWADRPIRGSNVTSNHASATAIDLNATRHPLGVRNTFTAAQVGEIRAILAEVDGTVRWGGDYTERADEMHFEINAGYARVKAVADRLKGGGGGAAPGQEDDMTSEQYEWLKRVVEENQRRINALPDEIWRKTTVYRDGKRIPALQELADAKTEALATRGMVAGLDEARRQDEAGEARDLEAVAAAAERGTLKALAEGTVTVDIDVSGPEGQTA